MKSPNKPTFDTGALIQHWLLRIKEYWFNLLLLYVLATSKAIPGWIATCGNVHSWRLVLPHWETRSPAPWLDIPLSLTLSWHWTNQSSPYNNNAEHLARKQQVSILKSLGWLDLGLNLWCSVTFWFPDIPIWEMDALFIWPFAWFIYSESIGSLVSRYCYTICQFNMPQIYTCMYIMYIYMYW